MVERICSFPSCGASAYVGGHCSGHYAQHRKGQRLRHIPRTLEERFWSKVEKTDDCWLWTGATNHLGYGQIWVLEERRVVMAHRVSLRLAGRECPTDSDVDHLCRTPSCIRPDHLEAVTHAENMARAPYDAGDFQSAKTHCPQGHEYTPGNIRHKVNSSGTLSRQCRSCLADSQRRYRARKRAGLIDA